MDRRPALTRLPLLDGLRTIAALGVMAYHVTSLFGATWLFPRGYLFVDLFFILSGFVLTLAAEPAMAGHPPGRFVRARMMRLWPLAALGTLAGALAFLPWTGWRDTLPLVIAGLAMVPLSRAGTAAFPLNGPQWSLLGELFANALHAVLLQRLSQRGLALFVGTAALLLIAAIAVCGSGAMGPNGDDWWYAAPRVCWSYGMGIIMARQWRLRGPQPVAGRFQPDWRFALMAPPLFLGGLAWLPLPRELGDGLAMLMVLPALFWLAANTRLPSQRGPALQRLGLLSFPLYALHEPILLVGTFAPQPALGAALASLAALGAAILCAWRWPALTGARRIAPA